MPKDLTFSTLLDLYGPILTQKQLIVMESYYNADLSLSEISTNINISRQGVHDSIKKAETNLIDIENKLHFVSRFAEIKMALEQIDEGISVIEREHSSNAIAQIRETLSFLSNKGVY